MAGEHGKRFSDASTTKKVKADWWEEDEWVEIKKFTYGQQRQIESTGMGVTQDLRNQQSVIADLRVDSLQFETLRLGIKAWNFTDAAGNVIPVSLKQIKQLNEVDGTWILIQIQEYNRGRVTQKQVAEATDLLAIEKAKGSATDVTMLRLLQENVDELEDTLQAQRDQFREDKKRS